MTLGNISWQEMFTDPYLQQLIQQGLDNNTDLQSAYWRVKEAEATLKSARLAYLPSFNFAPNGGVSSLTNPWNATWTYTVPATASWEVDIFGKLTNSKRRAKALLAQSQEYQQAVRTQVIASVANLYYTLLMLDAQYEISSETAEKWLETVNTMRAMKEAGMTNEAAVSRRSKLLFDRILAVRPGVPDPRNGKQPLVVAGEAPRSFERGTLDEQILPENLVVGIPAQMLSNRPDVKNAEYSLAQAFYNTAGARSAFYPALSLSGTLGWTNDGGVTMLDPAKWIFNAAASLVQPIFNAGRNQAQLRIAKAQQQEALLSFQQTLLNAGAEVNNALAKCQSARSKVDLRQKQVASLETAVESTQLLMRHGSTTYLEVLTAQQTLLSAQLSQINDRFSEIQAIVDLYHALGGGREIESETDK